MRPWPCAGAKASSTCSASACGTTSTSSTRRSRSSRPHTLATRPECTSSRAHEVGQRDYGRGRSTPSATRSSRMSTTFDPVPSERVVSALAVEVREAPAGEASVLGVLVPKSGEVPAEVGLSREALKRVGFTAGKGQTLVLPRSDGPTIVAVGLGEGDDLDAAALREAVGSFARSVDNDATIAVSLTSADSWVEPLGGERLSARAAGQAIVEGAVQIGRAHV